MHVNKLWIGLAIGASVLLVGGIGVSAAAGRWHWINFVSPPILIFACAMNLRDGRRARQWAAHYLGATSSE